MLISPLEQSVQVLWLVGLVFTLSVSVNLFISLHFRPINLLIYHIHTIFFTSVQRLSYGSLKAVGLWASCRLGLDVNLILFIPII